MKRGVSLADLRLLGAAALLATASGAAAQQARITALTDVSFGTISNFTTDLTLTQNVCVYSTATSGRYRVTATGSGTSSAFTLASGTNRLAYEVQWADAINQTTGDALTAGVALTQQNTSATSSNCAAAPTRTATLITILRTSAIGAAKAGTYTGTLTLLIAPN
jgi:hypothetical protein